MNEKSFRLIIVGSSLVTVALFLGWLSLWFWRQSPRSSDEPVAVNAALANDAASTEPGSPTREQQITASLKMRALLQHRLAPPDARANEANLTFESEAAYRNFLDRAGQAGLSLQSQIDRLRTVRVKYRSFDALFDDMIANPSDYQNAEANYLVHVPGIPAAENRPQLGQVPLGNNSLSFLGVSGDHSQWGRGITVAVLDTGVESDVTLGSGRIQYLDLGWGLLPGNGQEDGHGTAIAGLVAGAAADAPGVASSAGILSIRITADDGMSDSFTLAQAILAAVDAGSPIINVSMGSYSSSAVLTAAIDYAYSRGTVIVAAAGNDGAAQLTWPAADPRVISVGAVDALEQQVSFSNAGDQLKITAPGYGVDAAWLNGQRVSLDGTSASAPLVAGAIAAVMSTTPGLTAQQAWAIVQQFASDGGTPGPDSAYGNGILNLGWAMNRNDLTRVDTAIAGQYYDATAGMMNVVVQNRSAQAVSGLRLNTDIGGNATNRLVPPLGPGATSLFQIPLDTAQLTSSGGLVYRSQLINPSGIADQVPTNNAKSGVILAPAK